MLSPRPTSWCHCVAHLKPLLICFHGLLERTTWNCLHHLKWCLLPENVCIMYIIWWTPDLYPLFKGSSILSLNRYLHWYRKHHLEPSHGLIIPFKLHLPPVEIQGEAVTGTAYRQHVPAGQEPEMITDVGSTASMVCSQRSTPDKSREWRKANLNNLRDKMKETKGGCELQFRANWNNTTPPGEPRPSSSWGRLRGAASSLSQFFSSWQVGVTLRCST